MRQHFTSSLAWSSHPEPGLRAGFVAPFGPGSVACLGTSPTIVRDPFLSCVAWASHVFRLTSGLGIRVVLYAKPEKPRCFMNANDLPYPSPYPSPLVSGLAR